jgi:hypothetical protein
MFSAWSWYGQTPREPRFASSVYVKARPGATFEPGPETPGIQAPSDPNRYFTPWKCIEWRWFRTVSMFLKWILSVSPTRALMSGPGMPSLSPTWFARFGQNLSQLAVIRL